MSPSDRKAELVRNGQKMVTIARELGVTVGHISQVVSGVRRSQRIEKAIADAIGRPVEEVFGEADEPAALVA